jgi:hypothetical protein
MEDTGVCAKSTRIPIFTFIALHPLNVSKPARQMEEMPIVSARRSEQGFARFVAGNNRNRVMAGSPRITIPTPPARLSFQEKVPALSFLIAYIPSIQPRSSTCRECRLCRLEKTRKIQE